MDRKRKPGARARRVDPSSKEGDMGEGSFTESMLGDKGEATSRQGPKRVPVPDEDEPTGASDRSRS